MVSLEIEKEINEFISEKGGDVPQTDILEKFKKKIGKKTLVKFLSSKNRQTVCGENIVFSDKYEEDNKANFVKMKSVRDKFCCYTQKIGGVYASVCEKYCGKYGERRCFYYLNDNVPEETPRKIPAT